MIENNPDERSDGPLRDTDNHLGDQLTGRIAKLEKESFASMDKGEDKMEVESVTSEEEQHENTSTDVDHLVQGSPNAVNDVVSEATSEALQTSSQNTKKKVSFQVEGTNIIDRNDRHRQKICT